MTNTDPSSLLLRLRALPGLTLTDDRALQALVAMASLRDVPAGTPLITEGETGDEAYLLLSGALFVRKQSDDGRQKLVAVCDPGSVVGEMALLNRDPRSATVLAHIDSAVLVLDRKGFDLFRGAGPEIADNMLREMTRRMRSALNRMQAVNLIPLSTRLAITLGDLARDFGEADGAALRITIPLAVQDLADLVICEVDDAAGILTQWQQDGYLRQEGTSFTLLKPEEF